MSKSNKKFLLVLLAVCLICTLCVGLIACNGNNKVETNKPSKPNVPQKKDDTVIDSNVQTEMNNFMKALAATYDYDNSKSIACDFLTELKGSNNNSIKISLKGAVNGKIADECKFELNITDQNDVNLMKISADDEFLFVEVENTKYRFNNFKFAEMFSSKGLVDVSKINVQQFAIPIMAVGNLFDNVTVNGNETVYSGNLSNATTLVSQLVKDKALLEKLNPVFKLLNNVEVKFTTNIVDNKLINNKIALAVKGKEVSADTTKLTINNTVPEMVIPAKDDVNFVQSDVLNFNVEGKFDLLDKQDNYKYNDVVSFDYELKANVDLFQVVRNCVKKNNEGKIIFDKNGLFKTENAKFFFNVSHKCSDECTDFCNHRLVKDNHIGEGSILAIAYDPQNFESNKVYVSANLLYLVSNDFAVEMFGESTAQLLPLALSNNFAINFNPEVLLTLNEKDSLQASASSNAINVNKLFERNYLSVISDAIKTVESLQWTKNSVSISVNDILDLAENFNTEDKNIAAIVKGLFDSADTAKLTFNKAIYGDSSIEEFDAYRNFMIKDYDSAELKALSLTKTIEVIRDNKNFVRVVADGISNYDEKGNNLNLSADELTYLLKNGQISYNGNMVNGSTRMNTQAKILKVIGLDYSILDKPQTIKLVTEVTDGGGLNRLIGLAKMGMPDLELAIPGDVIETQVIISSVKSFTFEQPEKIGEVTLENKYDNNKVYKYGEKLNPQFVAKIVYQDGTSKEVIVNPVNANLLKGSQNDATLNTFDNFDLVYNVLGKTITKTVKMQKQNPTIVLSENPIELQLGEKYTIDKSQNVLYKDGELDKNIQFKFAEDQLKALNSDEVNIENYIKKGWFGSKTFKGYYVSFEKAGEYEVEFLFNGIAKSVQKFVVKAPLKDGYKAETKFETPVEGKNADTVKVTVSRANQYGNGLNINFDIFANDTLLKADQYKIMVKNNEGQLVDAESIFFEAFMLSNKDYYVVITDEAIINNIEELNVKVVAKAIDFDDAEIFTNNIVRAAFYEVTSNFEKAEAEKNADTVKVAIKKTNDLINSIKLGFDVYANETLLTSEQYKVMVKNDKDELVDADLDAVVASQEFYVVIADEAIVNKTTEELNVKVVAKAVDFENVEFTTEVVRPADAPAEE